MRGYRILAANARFGRSEIDLVVRRGTRLIFCEVKMRSRLDFGHPVEMVDEEKEQRIRRAASLWLAANPRHAGLETSFDIIGVHAGKIERFEGVF